VTVACDLGASEPLVLGESVSVDGVCLTVDAISPDGFEADASAETLARTTLGALPPGAPVNLERAMRAGDRFGGHVVGGHVDAVGEVVARRPVGEAVEVAFRVPRALAPLFATKGSVAVNGVSLTVNGVSAEGFDVTLIPATQRATGLAALPVGARVNVEVDVLARYVARQLALGTGPTGSDDDAWRERLARGGYV
jgi:riboflavin synthase